MAWCRRGVMVWLTVLASGAGAQVAPVMAVQRSKLVATEVELQRMRELPGNELQRLQAERRAACQSAPQSKACVDKSLALQVRRPPLLQRIEFIGKHAPLAKPGQPAPAGKCQSCHSSPGAAPAADPLVPAAGVIRSSAPRASPAADPIRPAGPAAPTTPPPAAPPPLPDAGNPKVEPKTLRCFIATAAYGSAYASEVTALRRFRDRQLLPYAWGRALVDGYYEISPPMARAIAERPLRQAAVRGVLTPMVWALEHERLVLGGVVLAVMLAWRRRFSRRRCT